MADMFPAQQTQRIKLNLVELDHTALCNYCFCEPYSYLLTYLL